MLGGAVRPRRASTVIKAGAAALAVLLLALAWHYTPIAALADPKTARAALQFVAQSWWSPIAVIAIFLAGGLVLFPLTVLIAATAAAFGPLLGLVYAGTGALASAMLTYLIGALGKRSLRDMLGPRLNRLRERVKRKGVLAVAAIRMVPIAPFSLVNVAAGASDIRFVDFMLGTAIGLAPGLIVMTMLGHELSQLVAHPSFTQLALLFGAVVAWIAVSIGVQVLVSRFEDADR
jgi:uncharacterized membrane protein YdjX (TVP38/TMEM64 family)